MKDSFATEDAQLVEKIARQDRQALSRFYDRYAGVLHSTAQRILSNSLEAADVLQEVFLQIWEEARDYDPASGKPFHWVLALTRQKAVSRLHALKRQYSFLEEVAQQTDATVRQPAAAPPEFPARELRARICSAVQALPLEQRQAIELAFLGGLNQDQIVERLHQPPGIIRARVRRGLMSLSQSLKEVS